MCGHDSLWYDRVSYLAFRGGLIRKTAMSVAIALIGMASVLNLNAGTLAGVTLPDTAQVGSTALVLNGLGLRTKYMIKVYVAGLYLPQKSSDPAAIIKADETKRIVMHFLHGASKSQMTDAFSESFSDNTPDAKKTMQAEIDRMLGALESVKEGDEMVFTYVPDRGTTLAIRSEDKVTVPGQAFGQMLFSVWLGPKPPNAGLKKGILGQ